MCGIIGTNFLSAKFDKSLELLHHRGPDFQNSIKIGLDLQMELIELM